MIVKICARFLTETVIFIFC